MLAEFHYTVNTLTLGKVLLLQKMMFWRWKIGKSNHCSVSDVPCYLKTISKQIIDMKWLVSAFWKETSNLSTMNVMISIQIVSKDKILSNSRNK